MKFLLPQRNQTGSTPKNRADQGDEREERGEEEGTGKGGRRERTITRKRLLMHGQSGQGTKHGDGPPRNP